MEDVHNEVSLIRIAIVGQFCKDAKVQRCTGAKYCSNCDDN